MQPADHHDPHNFFKGDQGNAQDMLALAVGSSLCIGNEGVAGGRYRTDNALAYHQRGRVILAGNWPNGENRLQLLAVFG